MPISNQGERADGWSPHSWRLKSVHAQKIEYPDNDALEKVCHNLEGLPPLVSAAQIEEARDLFAAAARGERFIVQGGDCAESFEDVKNEIIESKVLLLLQQKNLIESKLLMPVTGVGRIAGQYAKPRSAPMETLADNTIVPAFRGHIVNGTGIHNRNPDPGRLLQGYFYSAVTLNAISNIESPTSSAPTTQPGTPSSSSSSRRDLICEPKLCAKEIITSHEALLLPYESSLTRGRYCTSGSFLWVGERTRQLDGAHVEFLRGLRNPIGIKLSSKTSPVDLIALLNKLSPDGADSPGKLTLITRLGASNVKSALPPLIKAVQSTRHQPLWMSDPCHGNTATAGKDKVKTRCATTMLDEAQQTYAVHRSLGSRLGGLHLEQTGEGVAECVEHISLGTGDLSLGVNYRTLCDPRLSREQALLFVERFAEYVQALELEKNVHDATEARDEHRDKESIGQGLPTGTSPFVDDHMEELAAFAWQPPLLATMA
ncbi:MAG: hypothetical protein Q9219_007427 [cf. Caloplaca sp. 3 TL-2023]